VLRLTQNVPANATKVSSAGIMIAGFNKILIMIRKLKSGEYRIYSRKKNPKTNKRRNLGTFKSLEAAKKHEKAIQYFKHH
jgi:hypothetical protein